MGKSKSSKSKASRKTYEADMDTVEVKSVCPKCHGQKIATDNGTRAMPGYPLHVQGNFVGHLVAMRYVVCECGQHRRIKVVEAPAAAEK